MLWPQRPHGGRSIKPLIGLRYSLCRTRKVRVPQNSGQFILWSQAFLSLPYSISATNVAQDTAGAVALKAGYWNLVESIQISCQNKTVC